MVVYSNKKSTIQGSFARHNQSQRLTLLFTSGRLLPHFLFSIRAPTQIDTCVPVNESEHILKNERFKLPVLKIIYTYPESMPSRLYIYIKTTMMCCRSWQRYLPVPYEVRRHVALAQLSSTNCRDDEQQPRIIPKVRVCDSTNQPP